MNDIDSISNQIKHVKSRVENALNLAKSLGADDAEVALSRQQGLSGNTRMGEEKY